MGLLSRGHQLLVGLDIGSSSIKLCQLKETPKGMQLVKLDMAMLPPETILDGTLMNYDAVVEKIRELVSINNVRGKNCAISVSGHSVIVKKISLPEMTPRELGESIQWEAEQYIPFDIKDVNVDVQILNPKAGQGQMDVLLVAAKRDVVNDRISAVREVGLEPVVVDVDTFACQNVFGLNYGFPPNEVIVLMNVGASTISINVISNGITLFTCDISMGGSLLTEEIMKRLSVSWEEAEHYKTGESGLIFSSAIFREAQKCSEQIAETLVTEIQRSLDFFVAMAISSDIARIYLSGGAGQLSAFIRALERRFEVPVELFNSFQNIIVDSQKFNWELLERIKPLITVAVGLARRFKGDDKVGGGDVRINLYGQGK